MTPYPVPSSICHVLVHLTLAGGLAGTSLASRAALDVGDKAPAFSLEAALAGNAFRFTLADALKTWSAKP